MTVSAVVNKIAFPGPGGTVFACNFPIVQASDVEVYKTDQTTGLVVGSALVNVTDYAISGVGGIGFTVTLTADLGAYGLLIRRVEALTMGTNLPDEGNLRSSSIQAALDKLARLAQQLQEQLSRSLHTAISGLTADWTVPEPGGDGYVLGNVGKKFVWLAAASAQLAADLLSTAIGKGASLIGYLAPYTGAVARTVSDKEADTINARDFGATGGTAEANTAAAAITSGLIGVRPTAAFASASMASKQNVSYQQGNKLYTRAKANGEQFYGSSVEVEYFKSEDVVESSTAGTGADFTPSNIYLAIKFTTASDASFIQGLGLRVKKTGSLTDTSSLNFLLYTDSGGFPSVKIGGGGQIFGGEVNASYAMAYSTVQNVTTPLTPSTAYWIVITRSESGGAFVLDSAAGSGSFYQGAALGTVADTSKIISYSLFSRSAYGVHAVANHSHAVWAVTITGVGVRGDSTGHYGVYGQSAAMAGVRGNSLFGQGLLGTSTNGNGTEGSTSSATAYGVYGENTAVSGGYPGIYGVSASGPGGMFHSTLGITRAVGLRVLGGGLTDGFMIGSQYIGNGTVQPAAGQWYQGDIIFNTTPANSAGQPAGWICTGTGVPGYWRAFGVTV